MLSQGLLEGLLIYPQCLGTAPMNDGRRTSGPISVTALGSSSPDQAGPLGHERQVNRKGTPLTRSRFDTNVPGVPF